MEISMILSGLGYSANEGLTRQVERILSNCDLADAELSHLLALHAKIDKFSGFVAISNSEDVFKIKCQATAPSDIRNFNEIVKEWAEKYQLNVKKLDGKETYYLLGRK